MPSALFKSIRPPESRSRGRTLFASARFRQRAQSEVQATALAQQCFGVRHCDLEHQRSQYCALIELPTATERARKRRNACELREERPSRELTQFGLSARCAPS
jgi:hypothetical protein